MELERSDEETNAPFAEAEVGGDDDAGAFVEPLAYERYAGATADGSGAARELLADRMGSPLEVVETATGSVAVCYTALLHISRKGFIS